MFPIFNKKLSKNKHTFNANLFPLLLFVFIADMITYKNKMETTQNIFLKYIYYKKRSFYPKYHEQQHVQSTTCSMFDQTLNYTNCHREENYQKFYSYSNCLTTVDYSPNLLLIFGLYAHSRMTIHIILYITLSHIYTSMITYSRNILF